MMYFEHKMRTVRFFPIKHNAVKTDGIAKVTMELLAFTW
jgi:hypothetical protein